MPDRPSVSRRLGRPSLESLFVATFALGGFGVGARPIIDNSTFVHLRTGMDMVRGAGIPRADPYSFTARGTEWVVQSWLPAALYGWAERLGGFLWVVLLNGALMALLAWLMARLARTGTPLPTFAAAGIAMGIGVPWWSPRPLIVGLICMALVIMVVERRVNPWWLVPITWVWVQSHGSFPLGAAWLGLVILGTWIDRRAWPADLLRYAVAFVVGLVVACVNPLGPRLLTFPLTVGEKREIFRSVVEWRSPDFQSGRGLVCAVFIVLAVVVLIRARPPWRQVLPAAAFLLAGLVAMRNLAVLAVVVAPALGVALRHQPVVERDRPRINVHFAALLAVAALLFGLRAATDRTVYVRSYPVAATNWLEREGYREPGSRVATQDVVGCYLILRDGRDAQVFIDDRVDMYPLRVSKDFESLLRGRRGSLAILDRYRIDAVLWDDDLALATMLQISPDWRRAYTRRGWVVFVRES